MAEPQSLVQLLLDQGVLKFGAFTLKSGRHSPYFFNLGAVDHGASISALADAYAARIVATGLEFDVVFGPAYKGIPIAVATAEALARRGRDVGWAFNRKEAKDHGEGGRFVGAPLTGRVLVVDDVLTAGTAIRDAVRMLKSTGATLVGVVIALDRQERDADGATAVQALAAELGVPVVSILSLQDVIDYLDSGASANKDHAALRDEIRAYQRAYCIQPNVERS